MYDIYLVDKTVTGILFLCFLAGRGWVFILPHEQVEVLYSSFFLNIIV